MTSLSEPELALGAVTAVIAVVALLLALLCRKHVRHGRKMEAALKSSEARVLGMETAAKSAEARVQSAEAGRLGAESRADDAEARAGMFRDEVSHLVSVRLPALALHLISSHHPVPGLLHEDAAEPKDVELLDSVLALVSGIALKERRRVDAAARAALRGASQDSQALSYRLQTELDALQKEFTGSRSLTHKVLTADHLNEQNLRLIQRTAIVCGAWPGHVRKDTYVTEIVTGASSRLRGFERVKINSRLGASDIGIVGRAAEPIAVACTELMANALEHSRDDLAVDVSLVKTGNGSVCITVDDAGKGMTPEAVARGARLISAEQHEVMLTELGDPPSQGFAAIGRLVADHGFHVSIDNPSPYGGVRAVVTIPPNLLTSIDGEAAPPSVMAPLPAMAPRADIRPTPATDDAPAADDAATVSRPRTPTPGAAADLPQRRRRVHAAPTGEVAAPTHRAPDPERSRDAWSDFQKGLESGQNGTDLEETQ
ncbi:sensor histidine kinase [Streptomyces sp. KM273126]|uniref:ATP-binding protein n=1 Tax=Streptomyces sp. KM273126 TaxID=2545247 RepID=UPI00103CBABA|nr:ATP-binding protein [Streptomyces sp. KM273126]MBA2810071.1 sensor histidine kinase [Streptomyces sp. KM273126]